MDEDIVTAMCFWIFPGTQTLWAICRRVSIRRMEKHNGGSGVSWNLSMGNVFVFVIVSASFLNNWHAEVRHFDFRFNIQKFIRINNLIRYKPIIITSALVGIALWSILLWTTSIQAIIVSAVIPIIICSQPPYCYLVLHSAFKFAMDSLWLLRWLTTHTYMPKSTKINISL